MKITNVEVAKSVHPTQKRVYMEIDGCDCYVDVDVEEQIYIKGTFVLGSYPQALATVAAFKAIEENENA